VPFRVIFQFLAKLKCAFLNPVDFYWPKQVLLLLSKSEQDLQSICNKCLPHSSRLFVGTLAQYFQAFAVACIKLVY